MATLARVLAAITFLFFSGVTFANHFDVLVWGASPSGIEAAKTLAQRGDKVMLCYQDESIALGNISTLKTMENLTLFKVQSLTEVTIADKSIENISVAVSEEGVQEIKAAYYIDASASATLLVKAGILLQAEKDNYDTFSHLTNEVIRTSFWKGYENEATHHIAMRGYAKFSVKHLAAKNGIRPNIQRNSIASGYVDLMLTLVDEKGDSTFYETSPFTVPYFVIVAPKMKNVLATEAVSTTPLGYAVLNKAEMKQALGKAAGVAVSLCNTLGIPTKKLPVELLQRELIRQKQAIIYYSDVAADSPYFELSQYFGLQGFLNEIALNPNELVTEKQANFWQYLANDEVKFKAGKTTRGEVLTQLYKKNDKKY